MKDDILVIGGYGVVGQTICRELGRKAPGRVFAAGRNLERAERFCSTTAGSVLPLRLDIREPIGEHFFARFRAVVMCLDQENTDFLRACIRSGTHYADVTANNSFLSKAEGLHEDARANGAAVVLSVGLAPGLTNLLALEAVNRMDATATLDISVMLGLGDSHGDAAMEWTLQNVNKSFEVTENGGKVSVSAFTDGKLVDFGTGFGRKKAYRFNFPDQHTLPRTLRVPSVSTRLCFDSGAATMLLAGLKAVNMLSFLKTKPVRRAAIRVAGLIRWGQDSYALKVDAWGKKDERDVYVECFLNGSNEADMTGKVAAFVAEMLYVVTDLPRGVFHIDQVMTPTNIKPLLRKRAFVEIRVNGNIMA